MAIRAPDGANKYFITSDTISFKPLKMKKRKEEAPVGDAHSDEGFESAPEKVGSRLSIFDH